MKKAIFLDRDGVLNVDHGYVYKVSDFEFVLGIADVLLYLKKKGYVFIIVTDQSGIARGKYTLKDMQLFNNHLEKEFAKLQIFFEKIYFCPHHPDVFVCDCRKPSPKFWNVAKDEFNIDLSKSWTIGDKLKDCEAGKAAGTKTILLKSKYNPEKPDSKAADFFVEKLSDIKKLIKD